MKKALILCASHNDIGIVIALRKLGYYIICTGGIAGQIGERLCDEYIPGDYSNKELMLQIARDNKVDAIVNACNDFAVYSAAYVAERLSLPGYDSYETTLLLNNKDKFKRFAIENGIRTPQAHSFSIVKEAISFVQSVEYPIIIKPTDCSAGNGIHKAENFVEARDAIDMAFAKSRSKTIVIEPYINGPQYGFCTFLVNQKVVACCSNNEYSIVNPYRVEIDTYPADDFDKVKDDLVLQIEHIAKVLKLKDGIFHLQYIYDGKHAQIIEVMRRLLGNRYFVAGNLLTGIDWEYWETRAKCGLSCELFPHAEQLGFVASKVVMAPKNGVIECISGMDCFDKYRYGMYVLKKVGDTIVDYKSQPVAILYLIFSTREEMNRVLIENYRNDFVKIK